MNHYKEVGMHSLVFLLITDLTSSTALTWVRFQSRCYQADTTKATRSNAVQLCSKRSASLASFSDLKQVDAIKGQLSTGNEYWVWLTRHNEGYRWEDGSECCPRSWWAPTEPNNNDTCARFRKHKNSWVLYDMNCSATYGFICSKPAERWMMVDIIEYYWDDLCGTEVMANCDGLPCEAVCESHPDCDKFTQMSNLCINIKNATQTNNCVINLRKNMQLFQRENSC